MLYTYTKPKGLVRHKDQWTVEADFEFAHPTFLDGVPKVVVAKDGNFYYSAKIDYVEVP